MTSVERDDSSSIVEKAPKYFLERGYSSNIRQNLQFFLWKDDGFTLHPCIDTTKEGLRIAEIGLATGIWLLDIAKHVPPSAHIDGFDIDITQCPPRELRPTNISLHLHNCLEPFPEQFLSKYDIVHIQLFHLAIHNNEPTPVVKNFISLLKPGGYISWGEYDYTQWEILHTSEAANTGVDNLTNLLDEVGSVGGTRPNWAWSFWPSRLPLIYESMGLTDIVTDNRPFRKETLQYQLDTCLLACEEIIRRAIDPLGGGKGNKARELISKCFSERSNTVFQMSRLTVVGRKPL